MARLCRCHAWLPSGRVYGASRLLLMLQLMSLLRQQSSLTPVSEQQRLVAGPVTSGSKPYPLSGVILLRPSECMCPDKFRLCVCLAAGEELAGPYVWGRYDLLVLPPSFPYGELCCAARLTVAAAHV